MAFRMYFVVTAFLTELYPSFICAKLQDNQTLCTAEHAGAV